MNANAEQRKMAIQDETRVLVVLDQPTLAEVIRLTLSHGPFITQCAASMDEALGVLGDWSPAIIIVDVALGGLQLLERLGRESVRAPRIPVLALTHQRDLQTKLAAFEHGVDDIMMLPLSPEELLARVVVISRHIHGALVVLHPVLRLGEIEIDILQHSVRVGNTQLILTGLEQRLLYLLAANDGRTVSREQIIDALWGSANKMRSNVVDQHVRSLRTKLQDNWRKPRFIATVPGAGYRFVPTSA